MMATAAMIGIVIVFLMVINAKPLICKECGSDNLRTTFIKEKECHICNICGTNWDE